MMVTYLMYVIFWAGVVPEAYGAMPDEFRRTRVEERWLTYIQRSLWANA